MEASIKIINIAKFLDHQGRVIQLPAKGRTLRPVLQYLAHFFSEGEQYTEKQVNEVLQEWCRVDVFSARRALIDMGYLARKPDGAAYWREKDIPQSWAWHVKD